MDQHSIMGVPYTISCLRYHACMTQWIKPSIVYRLYFLVIFSTKSVHVNQCRISFNSLINLFSCVFFKFISCRCLNSHNLVSSEGSCIGSEAQRTAANPIFCHDHCKLLQQLSNMTSAIIYVGRRISAYLQLTFHFIAFLLHTKDWFQKQCLYI